MPLDASKRSLTNWDEVIDALKRDVLQRDLHLNALASSRLTATSPEVIDIAEVRAPRAWTVPTNLPTLAGAQRHRAAQLLTALEHQAIRIAEELDALQLELDRVTQSATVRSSRSVTAATNGSFEALA